MTGEHRTEKKKEKRKKGGKKKEQLNALLINVHPFLHCAFITLERHESDKFRQVEWRREKPRGRQEEGKRAEEKADKKQGSKLWRGGELSELSQLKVNYLSAKTTEFQSVGE